METQVAKLREGLALIAGVDDGDVVIDSEKRRAIVMAKPLPGASLQTYYALERRMVKQMPDWAINLQPPSAPLPELVVAEGELTNASKQRLEWISWAAARSPVAMEMSGSGDDVDVVATELAKQNLFLTKKPSSSQPAGRVRFAWPLPDGSGTE